MLRRSFRIGGFSLVLTIFVLVSSGLAWQQTQESDSVAASDITRWLNSLESDTYAERQKATRRLASVDVESVRPIVERMLNGLPESAARCSKLLSRIALNSEERDMTRVARILLLLSNNGFGHLRGESIALTSRWKQMQVERNIKRLKKVGIDVTPIGGSQIGMGGAVAFEVLGSGQLTPPVKVHTGSNVKQTLPSLDGATILQRVDEIIAATAEENNKSFTEEVTSKTAKTIEPSPTSGQQVLSSEMVIVGGEARMIVRGRGGIVMIDGRPQGASMNQVPYSVEIGEKFDGSQEDLMLLKLLPSIAQLTISDRQIDRQMVEALSLLDSLKYVTLQRCSYDLKSILELMEKRPGLTISASGHDSFLGVQLQTDLTSEGEQCCRVLEVVADTAASDAGIQNGDIIRMMNDVKVKTYEQLIIAIGSFQPGDEVDLDILRNDKEEIDLKVKLRKRPAGQ